jgi:hemolysin III
VYGSTLIVLYLASTLYHSFQGPRIKGILRRVDHASIFLLIAGTYTPFTLVSLRGPWGWFLFFAIWTLAAVGVLSKFVFTKRFRSPSAALYIGMGWLGVLAIGPGLEAIPVPGLVWLLAGGLAYTLGVIFYLWERLPFSHTVWHLFVLGGSVCHFFAILFFVLPTRG